MSLDAAIVDLGGAFEYGQGYVALSRVRTLAGLYLIGLNQRSLQVHPEVMAKDGEFRAQSDEVGKQFAALSAQELAAMQKDFVSACGGTLPLAG